jgi:hypothetical protein
MPVLFYPPLLFTPQISTSVRVGLFILLVAYLFGATKRFRKKDLFIVSLLAVLFSSLIVINMDSLDGLVTAGSVTLTLVFAYALSRAVEMNDRIKNNLVKLYTSFFILVPICSFMSIIFLSIFGELNLFNIHSGGQNFLHTPFGVILEKDVLGFGIYRSFFFFQEPVVLALFYAANIFLVAPNLEKQSRFFSTVNIIGGLLTFSYFFIVLSIILYFSKTTILSRENASRRLLLACFIIIIIVTTGFFSSSSMDDRIIRMNIFFPVADKMSALQFLFGQGFMQETGFGKSFSAGFLLAIYEIGIVNLVVLMLLTVILTNISKHIFILFFFTMLVFEPTKLPLFWVLVIVLSVLLQDKRRIKSSSILQCSPLVYKKSC